MDTTLPRRFHLDRHVDVHDVSGPGIVADGVLWPDGTATIHWRGEHASYVHWPRGVESVEAIHGHDGLTEVVWLDDEFGQPWPPSPTTGATTANPLTGRVWYQAGEPPPPGSAR